MAWGLLEGGEDLTAAALVSARVGSIALWQPRGRGGVEEVVVSLVTRIFTVTCVYGHPQWAAHKLTLSIFLRILIEEREKLALD